MPPVFTPEELRRLGQAHPQGLPAGTIIELFRQRGVELAEATFRKYVQLGLLPRSRRVGRKGKHRGSLGLYPAACVARLGEIRGLMDSGHTLEEIQRSALTHLSEVDAVRKSAHDVLERLEHELRTRGDRPAAGKRLVALHEKADALAEALEAATRDICTTTPVANVYDEPEALARSASAAMRGPDSSGSRASRPKQSRTHRNGREARGAGAKR